MTELVMIFVGGLLGAGHCVGMCGPIALSIGTPAPAWSLNLLRQLVYSAGRLFTYAVIGAVAGYAGMRLTSSVATLVNVQAVLAIVAGVLLIVQGMLAAGIVSIPVRRNLPACLAPGLLGAFLRRPQLRAAFLAGMFTGFLPCGLLYAYVALAASAGSLVGGSARMAAFGLGTVPLLVAMGSSGSLLGVTARQRALRIAALFVIATGVVSILRGAGYIGWEGGELAASCPMCAK